MKPKAHLSSSLLLGATLAASGCGIDLDPDSLVREVRILSARVGAPTEASVADVDVMADRLQMQVLAVAPSGPGRRVMGPRPLTVDVSLCLTQRAFLVPGSADPDCVKRMPRPEGTMALACPKPDEPLMPLVLDADVKQPISVPQAPVFSCLLSRFGGLLGGGGMGGGIPTETLSLRLPVVVKVRANASEDPLETETGFLFPRINFSLMGTPPPPNKNPVLLPILHSFTEGDESPVALTPCGADGTCTPLVVRRDQPVYLTAKAKEGSAETYERKEADETKMVTETLRFAWFATDGQFSETRTGEKFPTTRWRNEDPFSAPAEVSLVDVYVVVQDGRGGSDSHRYQLRFADN